MPRPTAALLLMSLLAGAGPAVASDPADLAARIDDHLRKSWEANGVAPAPPADDATFLRRAFLDLLGRTPTVEEVRRFAADASADKRSRLVDRLLGEPESARHWATVWRRVWLPQADTVAFANLAGDFEEWLRVELGKNTRYDRLAREVLVASPYDRPKSAAPAERGRSTPRAYLAGNEYRAENLAASTARAFLGINLDCAQCHDHPFARWTRNQFWETAAFYARPEPATADKPARLEMAIPGTARTVSAQLLTDEPPPSLDSGDADAGRKLLADWVTKKENPYFARNAVNRVWAQFFGVGLVEPLDDLSDSNPASHPELLDDLAAAFADSGYDLKFLTAAVARSRAYQLSSDAAPGAETVEPRTFARSPVRGLTGEQLYDSLRTAAGLPAARDDLDPAGAGRPRQQFAARFRVERPAAAQRSILQALAMMNGPTTGQIMDAGSPLLVSVADAPFLDLGGQIDTLFLSTLARAPTAEERESLARYVGAAGAGGRKARLADVLWALVNGSEFNTNH